MKTKTVNISLPPQVLEMIDLRARQEYKSRSDLIREAALEYVRKQNNWELFRLEAARRAKELGIRTEDDVEEMIDSMRRSRKR